MKCPSCQKEVPADAKKCGSCQAEIPTAGKEATFTAKPSAKKKEKTEKPAAPAKPAAASQKKDRFLDDAFFDS